MRLHYGFGDSTLGSILVAASDKGLCAIELGDDRPLLLEDLARRFARAHIAPAADPAFAAMIAAVVAWVEAPGPFPDLPLDLIGTDFQQKVWTALQTIPLGETLSYAGLAAQIGQPRAVRAVARACATNNVSLLVPCHRVIGSNGKLTGYAWGVARKQALLAREQAAQKRGGASAAPAIEV